MTRRDWLLASVAPLALPAVFRMQRGPAADLTDLPLAELVSRYRAGTLSPVDVTEAYLARIAALDGDLHAYVTVTADVARAQARAASALETRKRGPLHGVPIAHKDLFETAGIRTTGGSRLYEHHVPTQDATLVGAPVGGRRDHAGQDQHARTGRWRHHHQPVLRHHGQPSRPDADSRRIERRLGRGRRRAPRGGGDRQRHRRQHPDSGGAVRLRRLQADLRPAQHRRRPGRVADVRSRRLPHAHGGGPDATARSHDGRGRARREHRSADLLDWRRGGIAQWPARGRGPPLLLRRPGRRGDSRHGCRAHRARPGRRPSSGRARAGGRADDGARVRPDCGGRDSPDLRARLARAAPRVLRLPLPRSSRRRCRRPSNWRLPTASAAAFRWR